MSIHKNKKTLLSSSFDDVWNRLVGQTDIRYLKDIAEIIGITQQSVSQKKQEDLFPYGWIVPIARKYNLLTEWLLTGKGPKRLSELENKSKREFEVLDEIEEWLEEIQQQNPDVDRNAWFAAEMIDNFKSYRERKLRKDIEQEEEYSATSYKVA